MPSLDLAVPLDGDIELVEVGCLVTGVGIAGRLCLLRAHGIDGGVAPRGCCLLEHFGSRGRARAAFLGILGGGIDLVVGHCVGRGHLKFKGGLSAQVLPIALDRNLCLGGRDGVDGAVGRDGGGGDGERVIAGQQLNAATMLVNVERFAHGGSVRILATHLYGNLGAGGTVEPRGMYTNLHRHHRVGIGGDDGSLLLPVSVPGCVACAAGDKRNGHSAGDH